MAKVQLLKNNSRALIWGFVALIVFVVCVWAGYAGFQDRHWRAFINAGDRAYARGNYGYALRVYNEALQQARDLDPGGELEKRTLIHLSRTYQAQGRQDLARAAMRQAGNKVPR